MNKVGIVLVNYKDYAQKFLIPCRDSLRTQNYSKENIKIYIIDNASTVESKKFLVDIFPEAEILEREDGNYVAANALGFKEAIEDGCNYLVAVNMDTEMDPNWLQELVLALDSNTNNGIAQSKILLYPKDEEERLSPKINSLGNVIHYLGFGFTSYYNEPDREISGYPEINGYASGCSFIIRSDVYKKIGGYFEEFYMYHDDLELSLKTRLAGYKIILAPKSVIFHKYEFSRSTKMIYYMERNRYLSILTFYPVWLIFLISIPGFLMDLGMLFFSLINGWFKQEMKIYGYFLNFKNYRQIEIERKKIKQYQKIPFSKIAKDFQGKIIFQEIENPILRLIVNPLLDLYWRIIKKLF